MDAADLPLGGRELPKSTARARSLAAGNAFALIHAQLRGGVWEAHAGRLRVAIPAEGASLLPDVVVVPVPPRLHDEELDAVLDPVVVVEIVPTPDAGSGAGAYRAVTTLRDHLVVHLAARRVEHHHRGRDGGWSVTEREDAALVPLDSIGCVLPLRDLFAGVP